MTATQCACRQAEQANLVVELAAALRWAMSQPGMNYWNRLKGQNDAFCDGVDAARAALAKVQS